MSRIRPKKRLSIRKKRKKKMTARQKYFAKQAATCKSDKCCSYKMWGGPVSAYVRQCPNAVNRGTKYCSTHKNCARAKKNDCSGRSRCEWNKSKYRCARKKKRISKSQMSNYFKKNTNATIHDLVRTMGEKYDTSVGNLAKRYKVPTEAVMNSVLMKYKKNIQHSERQGKRAAIKYLHLRGFYLPLPIRKKFDKCLRKKLQIWNPPVIKRPVRKYTKR